MPLNLFYTMVQKSQKWPKTQIKGGSCLKWPFQCEPGRLACSTCMDQLCVWPWFEILRNDKHAANKAHEYYQLLIPATTSFCQFCQRNILWLNLNSPVCASARVRSAKSDKSCENRKLKLASTVCLSIPKKENFENAQSIIMTKMKIVLKVQHDTQSVLSQSHSWSRHQRAVKA